jgi:peptide/nickel transport system permease protein
MGATQLGIAIPNFWFAMLLVYVFRHRSGWFPPAAFPAGTKGSGRAQGADAAGDRAGAAAGGDPGAVMRSALLEVLGEDYMRTARAKGLTRSPGAVAARRCATR